MASAMLSAKLSACTVGAAARPSRRVVKTLAVYDTEEKKDQSRKTVSDNKTRHLQMSALECECGSAASDRCGLLLRDARTLPGICDPFPNMFDPAGLAINEFTTPDDMKRWRESELTHGRVAMLAALGFVVQEQTKDLPFFLNNWGNVQGPALIHFQQIEAQRPLFWEILVFCIGLAEVYRVAVGWATPLGEDFNQLRDDYENGNLGFDPLGLKPSDPVAYKDMQTRELNNGRLAMMSIIAFWLQEIRDPNHTIIEQFKMTLTGEQIASTASDIVGSVQNVP